MQNKSDYEVIHEAIIASKGCEDEFPYEYKNINDITLLTDGKTSETVKIGEFTVPENPMYIMLCKVNGVLFSGWQNNGSSGEVSLDLQSLGAGGTLSIKFNEKTGDIWKVAQRTWADYPIGTFNITDIVIF